MKARLPFLLFGFLLVACGDNGSGLPPDGAQPDRPVLTDQANTGETRVEAAITEAGTTDVGPPDAGSDAPAGVEGGMTEAGPVIDGPLAVDGGVDAPNDANDVGVDAPADQGTDAPPDSTMDAPADQGAAVDGPAAGLDGPQAEMAVSLDAPVVLDTSVVGQNDAGKYMCQSYSGTVVCQCNDGLDNDADKKIDHPDDPGCFAAWDNNELDGLTQCTDGKDNDGDGKIDAADPECTGPLDDDESSYGSGIPGDNVDCKADCFFDGNSGAGDDDCVWNLKCDPLDPAQHLPPPQKNCTYTPSLVGGKDCPPNQSAQCLGFCLPITPNGCDCFGCCAVPYSTDAGTGMMTILLKPTCQAKPDGTIDPWQDDDLPYGKLDCPPCTQVADCLNTCGLCEVCIGKPAPDPSCFLTKDGGPPTGDGAATGDGATTGDGGGETPFCAPGLLYCGPGGIPPNQCPPGTYCITGCCVPSE